MESEPEVRAEKTKLSQLGTLGNLIVSRELNLYRDLDSEDLYGWS